MATIEGIVLPDSLGDSLGGTPEEAAKVFLKAASEGLAQVVADSLTAAVGEALGGETADWAELITGASIQLDWATPPSTTPQRTVAFASPSALGGVSVGISVSATF
ncbi:MAG: hypothetical protein AAF959_16425 [Cyanobacteria bacterium P01_D01_bin.56]